MSAAFKRGGLWRSLTRLAVLALAGALLASSSHAQTSKGLINGVVRDASGLAVAKATVTLTAEESADTRTATTNDQGGFLIDAVNPGWYKVRVEAGGFASIEVTHLKVEPSIATSYNATLRAGSNQTVSVEAGGNLLNTENGTLAGTISQRELMTVPVFSSNPIELSATLPGVQLVDQNLNLNGLGGNGFQVEVNGARPRSNSFMVDGQEINDVEIGGQAFQPGILEAFDTMTVLLNVAPAEYGRGSGAIVNLVTKSGTNTVHGDIWDTYQGSGLDSLDGVTRQQKQFATPANPIEKARFDSHQMGFLVGGPVVKDKLFVFGGAQFYRFYGKTSVGSVELPNAAGFATLNAIGGPQVALLEEYLSNGSYLSSYADIGPGSGMKIGSRPGCPGGCTMATRMFQRAPVQQQNPDTQWVVRGDYHTTDKDSISYRIMHDYLELTPDLSLNQPGLPGFDGVTSGPAMVQQAAWTHILTPTLLNEFRLSATQVNFFFRLSPETLANPVAQLPEIQFLGAGFANANPLGAAQDVPQGRAQDLYQVQDTVSWTHGKHNLRMGADLGRQLEKDLIPQLALGSLVFAKGGGQSSLDNFLDNFLGATGAASRSFGPSRADPHSWKLAFFGQDDWKPTPTLSLNLGVRYDYVTAPDNSLPYPAIDIDNPFQSITTVVKVQNDKNNFSPRVGFAWNPRSGWFRDGKTVIHSGLATFYDLDFTNIMSGTAVTSPNSVSPILTSPSGRGLGNATSLLATMSPVIGPTDGVESVSNKLVNPMTWQTNLGVQRQLPWNIVGTINYVGTFGESLYANQELNYFVNGTRLGPNRGPINIRSNRGASNYNGLQIDANRKFKNGLFFEASYTWSKTLDDASEVFPTYAAPTAYSADLSANNLHSDWGPSVWDHRNVVSFAYSWTPAGFTSSNEFANGVLGALTRNWTISGSTQLSSGPYSTWSFVGVDSNNDGSAQNDRPTVGNPKAPLDTVGFDGAFFGPPFVAGSYYDANGDPVDQTQQHWLVPNSNGYIPQEIGRNSYQNPGLQYWNIALQKEVPTSYFHFDRGTLTFRIEAENFTNHDNTGPLDIDLFSVGTASFMNRQNAVEGMNRHLQLWAKFRFIHSVITPCP